MRINVILSQGPSKSKKKRPVNYNYWQVQWEKKAHYLRKNTVIRKGSLRFKLENLRKENIKSEGFIQMQKSMQACFVDGRMANVPT